MNEKENEIVSDKITEILGYSDLIFRIGNKKKSHFEKLQLLVLKMLLLLWEMEDTELLNDMEKELSLIDDIRHELTFIRARLYKRILEMKTGLLNESI